MNVTGVVRCPHGRSLWYVGAAKPGELLPAIEGCAECDRDGELPVIGSYERVEGRVVSEAEHLAELEWLEHELLSEELERRQLWRGLRWALIPSLILWALIAWWLL